MREGVFPVHSLLVSRLKFVYFCFTVRRWSRDAWGIMGYLVLPYFFFKWLDLGVWKKKALLYILILQFIHKIIISLRYTYKINNFVGQKKILSDKIEFCRTKFYFVTKCLLDKRRPILWRLSIEAILFCLCITTYWPILNISQQYRKLCEYL